MRCLARKSSDYVGVKQWTNTGTTSAPNFVRSDSWVAVVPLVATTLTSGGAVGTWQPTEGGPVIISRLFIVVTTASTGAANVNAGYGTSATTSYSQLVPATSVHTTGSVIDSIRTNIIAATAAESGFVGGSVYLPSADYVTFTGSASTAGMVANAYIAYFKP